MIKIKSKYTIFEKHLGSEKKVVSPVKLRFRIREQTQELK